MKNLALFLIISTSALLSVGVASAQHRLWDGTKADCQNASGLEKNTAAWYDTCVPEEQQKLDDLRNRLRGRLGTPAPLPPVDPRVRERGEGHVNTEREQVNRGRSNDPHSDRSTITGPIMPNRVDGGDGTSRKISRPDFLGGKKGGVELGGKVKGSPGNLDGIHDAIKELPRGTGATSSRVPARSPRLEPSTRRSRRRPRR
jgi:hypothetical protein